MKNILYLLLPLLCVSCGKFLEPKSPSEFVPKNVTSLDEMLITEAYYKLNVVNMPMFYPLDPFTDDVEITSENAYFGISDERKEVGYRNLLAITSIVFDDMSALGKGNSSWETFYKSILACNAALDYLPQVTGSASEKAYVKAQSLFLRALGYFYLVNQYGQPYNYNKKALGVILKLDSNLSAEFRDRATVEQVYEQIMLDLLEAEKCWEIIEPAKHFRKDFRVNLPATQLLIARVNLFMENWRQAALYAEKVTEWSNFSLLDLNGIAQPVVRLVNYGNYNNTETILPYGTISDGASLLNTTLYMPKSDPMSTTEALRSRRMFVASKSLMELYVDGDLRDDLYLFNEWASDLKDNEHKTGQFIPGIKSPLAKINHNDNHAPLGDAYNAGLSFRLSEAYVIIAESYAMLNLPEKSLMAINTLREKRIATASYSAVDNLSGEALIEFVREERRREFCFEATRWFDMRRWGMKSFKREWRKFGALEQIYTISENDNGFTFPIPLHVIKKNQGITQNPLSPRSI